jgi:hypothetical protein
MTQEAFKAWWYNEGSQAPYTHHDCEEHTMRMCEIAWANGAYKEREACANIAHQWSKREDDVGGYIEAAIRARGQA